MSDKTDKAFDVMAHELDMSLHNIPAWATLDKHETNENPKRFGLKATFSKCGCNIRKEIIFFTKDRDHTQALNEMATKVFVFLVHCLNLHVFV